MVLEPVDTQITLARWLGSHSADSVRDSPPSATYESPLCRVATATVQAAGRAMQRYAVFGLPDPPAGELLPDSADALRDCTLRAMVLVATSPAVGQFDPLADSIGRELDALLGAGKSGIPLPGTGTRLPSKRRTWTTPRQTVVVRITTRVDSAFDDETGRPIPAKPEALVISAIATDGSVHDDDDVRGPGDDERDAEREASVMRADSALALASVHELSASLRPLLDYVRAGDRQGIARPPALDSALVRAVSALNRVAPSLDPAHRAAAFIALDVALERYASTLDSSSHGTDSVNLLRILGAAGVKYGDDPLGATHVYPRHYLNSAWSLDSVGRAGRLAFVELLADGWDTGINCGGGTNFEAVIVHGEAGLARGISDPQAHYQLGLGYADIVAMADRPDDIYSNHAGYTPRAPAARVAAVAHLRAALRGLTDRRLRRHAWRTALALMLGRSTETRFYCIYD